MAFVPDDRIGSLGAADLARFLAEPWNARIATVDDEGWPYVTPVWYEFDAATRTFEIVGRERAAWVAHIAREPRVALHIADDGHAQHTRVVVQGVAEAVEGPVAPAASARIGALTERLGPSGPMYAARTAQRPRMLIRIRPTRWRSWTGQEWHPRYR
jgi:PPOX class probable F420-dependent enzyme